MGKYVFEYHQKLIKAVFRVDEYTSTLQSRIMEDKLPINILELRAVRMALQHRTHPSKGQSIRVSYIYYQAGKPDHL